MEGLVEFVTSSWTWLGPLAGAVGTLAVGGISFLLKRRIENKPTSEKIDMYKNLADLQEKLKKGNCTISDLDTLRATVMGEKVFAQSIVQEETLLLEDQFGLPTVGHVESESDSFDLDMAVLESPHSTQTELNEASASKAQKADERLKGVVDEFNLYMGPEEREAFRIAQEAWEDFVAKEAALESVRWAGGSIRPLMVNALHESLTVQRIEHLVDQLTYRKSTSEPQG